jgi:hypothetical protein
MLMDVPPPGLDIGLQIGDTVHDGHGKSRLLIFLSLALSSTQNVFHPTGPKTTKAGLVVALRV